MGKTLLLITAVIVAATACGREQAQAVAPQPVEPRAAVPKGAKLEPSGFLTIETAPDSPAPPAEPPRRPQSERTYYAELAGVSNEEAAKRVRAQEALRPRFERILAEVRKKERGNFTAVELIHKPDWAYLLYFKRDPERTLAKYTRDPRIKAKKAQYTPGELQKMAQPWIDRFDKERLITGYGMNARHGTADIDLVVSEEELDAIAARNGWGPLPAFLRLRFDEAVVGPPIDASVAQRVRIFPQSDRNLGIIHMAAFGGRIVLRDGCFFVEQGLPGRERMLAYFPREVGLYIDAQNYLALRTRAKQPRHLGRIGERFSWAGPIGITEDAPMVADLRKRCGNAPLMHLSIAESAALFNARYPGSGTPPPPPPPPPKR